MKIIRKSKKGFTIVELVIVIAVIAVLAAVLIPTFISLTAKANKASDESLVTSLNKALAIEEVDHKVNNMHDAVESLKREGYLASALVTKSDQKLLYDLDTNRFLLEEDKESGKADYKYWTIADAYDADNQAYSIYASDNFQTTNIANLKVGFDAGDSNVVESISYVGRTEAQDVFIRTNGGSLTINAANDKVTHYGIANKVDIQAVASTSYVENGIVSIAKIKTGRIVVTPEAVLTSIHVVETNGNFNNIKVAVVGNAELPDFTRDDVTMNDGDKKLVIEVQSIATLAAVDESPEYIWISKTAGTTSTDVATSATTLDDTTKVPSTSQTASAKAVANDVVEGTTAEELAEMEAVATRYAGGQGIESNPYLLATKTHFGSLDEDYHNGVSAGKYYKLVNDIDLGKTYPIGSMSLSAGSAGSASQGYTITYSSSFEGSIDGDNHSITYSMVTDDGFASGSNVVGLFGSIKNSTIKNLIINANVSSTKNAWVGGLAGFGWYCNLENVVINGSVTGDKDVGGFFGYYANNGIDTTNTFKNCINNATVTCNSKRTGDNYAICGGFIGQLSPEEGSAPYTVYSLIFDNCQSNGSIIVGTTTAANTAASYFVGFASDNGANEGRNIRFVFNNCSIGNDASFSSTLGDTRTKNNKAIYCGSSVEAIQSCPAIKYVGVTSNLWGVNPSNGAKVKVVVNNVEQDMSLYFVTE